MKGCATLARSQSSVEIGRGLRRLGCQESETATLTTIRHLAPALGVVALSSCATPEMQSRDLGIRAELAGEPVEARVNIKCRPDRREVASLRAGHYLIVKERGAWMAYSAPPGTDDDRYLGNLELYYVRDDPAPRFVFLASKYPTRGPIPFTVQSIAVESPERAVTSQRLPEFVARKTPLAALKFEALKNSTREALRPCLPADFFERQRMLDNSEVRQFRAAWSSCLPSAPLRFGPDGGTSVTGSLVEPRSASFDGQRFKIQDYAVSLVEYERPAQFECRGVHAATSASWPCKGDHGWLIGPGADVVHLRFEMVETSTTTTISVSQTD